MSKNITTLKSQSRVNHGHHGFVLVFYGNFVFNPLEGSGYILVTKQLVPLEGSGKYLVRVAFDCNGAGTLLPSKGLRRTIFEIFDL